MDPVKALFMESLTQALVDEFGLETTLGAIEKADEKYAEQYHGRRNPDFIGMAGFAKVYAEQNSHEGRS